MYVYEIPYNVVISQKEPGLLYIARTIVQNENLFFNRRTPNSIRINDIMNDT
jgi:hypothetical protein